MAGEVLESPSSSPSIYGKCITAAGRSNSDEFLLLQVHCEPNAVTFYSTYTQSTPFPI
jgi:hypothetical protein